MTTRILLTAIGRSLLLCGLMVFSTCLFSQTTTTYNINTAANSAVGGICPGNPGIDETFDCAFDGSPAIDIGDFSENSSAGATLDGIDLVIYGACSGDVEFFLNGVSIATGTASGLACSCQSIDSDPNVPQNYTAVITPAAQTAFVPGGTNTLSVAASNSAAGAQCFYGADVMVTTSGGNACSITNVTNTVPFCGTGFQIGEAFVDITFDVVGGSGEYNTFWSSSRK